MPSRLADIGEIVELVSNNNWIINVADERTRVHLGEIVARILDKPTEQLDPFVEQIKLRKEVFKTEQ